jgi:hypothetical protein
MCDVPDGGGRAGPGTCAGDACCGVCWFVLLLLGLSGASSLAYGYSYGDRKKGPKPSSPMAATTRGKRDVYAPKDARQSRALSLGLLCLLLAWPRHARLRWWPTVAVPWIHLGFTKCWPALRQPARVGAGRVRGQGDASDSAEAHGVLVGSLQGLRVGAGWSELKLVGLVDQEDGRSSSWCPRRCCASATPKELK